ncbi:MAG: hypothetical protein IKI83_00960, partial [Prevotella sp.]|nr:hypothetical protein [Prevotella sp.]
MNQRIENKTIQTFLSKIQKSGAFFLWLFHHFPHFSAYFVEHARADAEQCGLAQTRQLELRQHIDTTL